MRRYLLTAALGWGLVTAAQVATADTSLGFDLVFDDGPLSGQTFSGTMVLDLTAGEQDPTDTDLFTFSPNFGLVSFNVTIDGVAFTAQDDDEYPDFPEIIARVSNNTIVVVDYLNIEPPSDHGLSIFFDEDLGANFVGFDPPVTSTAGGSTGYFVQTTVTPIPDGGSLLGLLGIGLAGLGVFRRFASVRS